MTRRMQESMAFFTLIIYKECNGNWHCATLQLYRDMLFCNVDIQNERGRVFGSADEKQRITTRHHCSSLIPLHQTKGN